MIPPEYARAIEFDRTRAVARSRLERLANCARASCKAPNAFVGLIGRILRRPAPCC